MWWFFHRFNNRRGKCIKTQTILPCYLSRFWGQFCLIFSIIPFFFFRIFAEIQPSIARRDKRLFAGIRWQSVYTLAGVYGKHCKSIWLSYAHVSMLRTLALYTGKRSRRALYTQRMCGKIFYAVHTLKIPFKNFILWMNVGKHINCSRHHLAHQLAP